MPRSHTNGSRTLTPAEAANFGAELDALRDEVISSLGEGDVTHIRNVIRASHYSELIGRLLLHLGVDPVSFVIGTGALSVSKILENMEIGHNIMHGQYDWTGDPALDGQTYEWDHACDADDWREYHNYEHHTYTNVLGKDRDIGYRTLRVTADQPWFPAALVQPLTAAAMAVGFQWGVGAHNMRTDLTVKGIQSPAELGRRARRFFKKATTQMAKDYVFYPLLALHNAPRVLAGNLSVNLARNLWTYAVIFCGHFPEGAQYYPPETLENESRGAWYARQLNGSVNIEGGALFHLMTGHLSHQIEHHLFPDIPAARYPGLAARVRDICEAYDQAYNTGSFTRQMLSVAGKLFRHALPSSPKLATAG